MRNIWRLFAFDIAAPLAGDLPSRAGLVYFVTHPCHPSVFGGETESAAQLDFFGGVHADLETGVRVGIIARKTSAEAWQVAHERFPEDRKGQLTHQLAQKSSDSAWHEQLSKLPDSGESPYWLVPFQNYKSFCPYLVGSYECVAEEVSRYLRLGHSTFVLDIPPNAEELESIGKVFDFAKNFADLIFDGVRSAGLLREAVQIGEKLLINEVA